MITKKITIEIPEELNNEIKVLRSSFAGYGLHQNGRNKIFIRLLKKGIEIEQKAKEEFENKCFEAVMGDLKWKK